MIDMYEVGCVYMVKDVTILSSFNGGHMLEVGQLAMVTHLENEWAWLIVHINDTSVSFRVTHATWLSGHSPAQDPKA